MKKKSILFIVLSVVGVIVLVIIILGLLRQIQPNNNALIKIKNNMINKLDNFSYRITSNTNIYGVNFDIGINCSEDRKNLLGYCNLTSNVINIEEYMDYKNKKTYTKTDAMNDNYKKWVKKEEKDISNSTKMLDVVDNVDIKSKEKTDTETIYKGYARGKSLGSVFKMVSKGSAGKVKASSLFKAKVPVTIIVNKDNYIEKITFDFSVLGIKEKCEIDYYDFNNTLPIELPKELNEI